MKHLRNIPFNKLEVEAPEVLAAILRGFERYGGIFNPHIGRYFNRIANEVREEGYNITPPRVQRLHYEILRHAGPGMSLSDILAKIARR